MPLIAALRIRGKVDVRAQIRTTMDLLGLRKKHALIVLEDTPSVQGMLAKAKDFITYGPLSEATLLEIYKAKGIESPEKAVKSPKEHNPLHLAPPRGGFKSIKKSVGAHGDLGKREEMDSLLRRMI